MRNWIDLLESKELHLTPWTGTGPLFHGTDILGLSWIMASDKLNASIDHSHAELQGVSLTYDVKTARQFAERSAEIFDENHYTAIRQLMHTSAPTRGAVIKLDSAKLRTAFRLVHYWDDATFFQDDEKEVRVMTPAIKPLSSFITSFTLRVSDLQWYADYLRTDYGKREHGGNSDKAADSVLALAKSPLLKPIP